MKKYYIKKEKIQEELKNLLDSGKVPGEYTETLKETVERLSKTIRDNQYMIIEVGTGIKAYNTESAKVPLHVRLKEGEDVDSVFYF